MNNQLNMLQPPERLSGLSWSGKIKQLTILSLACLLVLSGCDTNVQLATEAAKDAIKTVTLSDKDVHELAVRAASFADRKNRVAPPESSYTGRLHRLVGNHLKEGGYSFNYKAYLSPEVNAFAMADGTINSKLMDIMDDGELRFVIGHEMGHVVKKHIRKKIMLAYAGSALRKGIASQENLAGDISRSALGGFVETLLNAQFSQQEEKEADDYGLAFLKNKGYDTRDFCLTETGHPWQQSHISFQSSSSRQAGRTLGGTAILP